MLSLLSKAALTASSLDDCPWEDAEYYRYGLHNAGAELISDVDSCKVITYMESIIADLDDNQKVDRCEFSLMCIGTGAWGKVDTTDFEEGDWMELGKGCAEHAVSYGGKEIEAWCEAEMEGGNVSTSTSIFQK